MFNFKNDSEGYLAFGVAFCALGIGGLIIVIWGLCYFCNSFPEDPIRFSAAGGLFLVTLYQGIRFLVSYKKAKSIESKTSPPSELDIH